MRSHPTHAVLLLCLAGCATIQESSQIAQKPSAFAEQTDADTILASAPAPLPIRAVPNQRLPIQAMTNAGPDLNSTGPLAGIITKAPAGLPIAAVGANQTTAGAATAPVREVAQAVPVKPKQTWLITPGDKSVRSLLERWSKSAGYQLLWEISVDLELNANATMTGSFEDALTSVVAALKNSDYPIEAMIYDNKVVRMVKRTPRNK